MTHIEIQNLLRARIAQKLNLPLHSIDLHAAIEEYGLDSLEVINFSGEIEEQLGIRIDPSALWEHRTIWQLSLYLAREIGSDIALPDAEAEIDMLLNQLGETP